MRRRLHDANYRANLKQRAVADPKVAERLRATRRRYKAKLKRRAQADAELAEKLRASRQEINSRAWRRRVARMAEDDAFRAEVISRREELRAIQRALNPHGDADRNKRWREANPDKAKARGRRRTLRDLSRRNAPEILEQIRIVLRGRRLHSDALDDVSMTMLEAVLDGRLDPADIPGRAAQFVRAHNRENDHYKTVSLDGFIPGTNIRRIDALEDPSWANE